MLAPEKLARIKELTNKTKETALTTEELREQQVLRAEYLDAFRNNMRQHIEGIKVVDPEGTDVTPDKLKAIQSEKGIHGRGPAQ